MILFEMFFLDILVVNRLMLLMFFKFKVNDEDIDIVCYILILYLVEVNMCIICIIGICIN